MAGSKVINLKAFFSDEARRFTVDESACTSFIFMKEKLQTIFPSLRASDFKVTWKDSDGDEITISSDEDLIMAFTEMSSDIKVLYIATAANRPKCGDFKFMGGQSQGRSSGSAPGCPFGSANGMDLKDMNALGAMARQYLGPLLETINASASQGSQSQGQSSGSAPGCPFGSANGMDSKDMNALGAMARQYLGPLLETVNASASQGSQGGNATNNNQEGVFMDILRNAAEGFFGGNNPMEKQQQTQSQQQSPKNPNEQPATSTSSASFVQQPNSSKNSDSQQKTSGTNTNTTTRDAKIAAGLEQLRQMGFKNDNNFLTHLLECFDGNVTAAVKALTDMKLT